MVSYSCITVCRRRPNLPNRGRQNYMSIRKDLAQIVLKSSESEIVENGSYVLTQSCECEYSVWRSCVLVDWLGLMLVCRECFDFTRRTFPSDGIAMPRVAHPSSLILLVRFLPSLCVSLRCLKQYAR